MKGKFFRIGHMGVCSMTDILATYGAIEATLRDMGYDFEPGAAVKAVVEHM